MISSLSSSLLGGRVCVPGGESPPRSKASGCCGQQDVAGVPGLGSRSRSSRERERPAGVTWRRQGEPRAGDQCRELSWGRCCHCWGPAPFADLRAQRRPRWWRAQCLRPPAREACHCGPRQPQVWAARPQGGLPGACCMVQTEAVSGPRLLWLGAQLRCEGLHPLCVSTVSPSSRHLSRAPSVALPGAPTQLSAAGREMEAPCAILLALPARWQFNLCCTEGWY